MDIPAELLEARRQFVALEGWMARYTEQQKLAKTAMLLDGTAPLAENREAWDTALQAMQRLAIILMQHPWLTAIETEKRADARQHVREAALALPIRICVREIRQINNSGSSSAISRASEESAGGKTVPAYGDGNGTEQDPGCAA